MTKQQTTIRTILRFSFFGLLLWLPFFLLTAHVYWEPWVWRVFLWVQNSRAAWWPNVPAIENGIMLVALVALLGILFGVTRVLQSTAHPMPALLSTIGTLLVVTLLVFAFSLAGGERGVGAVLRDVGGTLPGLALSLSFVVLLPWATMPLLTLLWQKRKNIRALLQRRR